MINQFEKDISVQITDIRLYYVNVTPIGCPDKYILNNVELRCEI